MLPAPIRRRSRRLPTAVRQMLSGTLWTVAGAGVSRIGVLAASILIARILGSVEFGMYAMVLSSMLLFQAFASLGSTQTASRFIAHYREIDLERAGRIAVLTHFMAAASGLVIAALLCLVASPLASDLLGAPSLARPLQVASVGLVFSSIGGAQSGALLGLQSYRANALFNSAGGLMAAPLTAVGAYLWGVMGAAAGLSIAWALVGIMGFFIVKREAFRKGLPLLLRGWWQEKRVLISFSLPAVFASIMITPVTWACLAIIANGANGYSEVGIYNAANQWRMAVLFVPTMAGTAALPALSRLRATNSQSSYTRSLIELVAANVALAVIVSIPLALLAGPIMSAYGSSFSTRGAVLALLAAAGVFASVVVTVGQSLAADNRMWLGLGLNTIWAAVLLIGTLVLRERGANGLAAATLTAYATHALVLAAVVWRHQKTGRLAVSAGQDASPE